MIHKSYKLRVALGSCLISGIVLLVYMTGVTLNLKTEFAELVDHDVEAVAAALLAGAEKDAYDEDPFISILSMDPGSYRGAIYEDVEDLGDQERNVRLLAVTNPQGEFTFTNAGYWDERYVAALEETAELEVGAYLSEEEREQVESSSEEASDARWEIRRYQKNGYAVFLAINQHENKDEYIEFLFLGAMALPFAFLVVAIGGWRLGVYAVKPMVEISQVVSSVKTEDLTTRVPHGEREDEIGNLARLVNDMLGRIESGYAQAKRFTADASHELRTPLAILQGELEARMRHSSDEEVASSGRMLEEIRRLKTLTHSLLFLSKADAGNLKVEKSRIDLSSLVSQTFADIEEISHASGLEFDDSEIVSGVFVEGDSSLIQQIVMNLLRNAVKFNRSGGSVKCSLKRDGKFACMVIGNTGSAIPPESRDKVFDRFHRVDEGRSRDKGGFGLGLNIAREIARSHDGEVELLEGGADWTEFILRLPLSESQ